MDKNLMKFFGGCVLCSVLSTSECQACDYRPGSAYVYSSSISEQSKAVNGALIRAVNELIGQLSAENRSVTQQDTRRIADEFFMAYSGELADADTEDFSIVGRKSVQIPLRLYKSASDALVFFIHGGAWQNGSIDTHDYLCRKMAQILGCNILSTSYGLAPEHRFPDGLNDLFDIYNWCIGNPEATERMGQIQQIYLSGDSSGGNLGAALNLMLNQSEADRKPDGLILFYPVLSSNMDTESFRLFGSQAALTAQVCKASAMQYVGDQLIDPKVRANELIFPINGDAKAYPRTLMVAAECDVLIDGQLELCNKLHEANVPVKLLIEPGAVHGFMTYGRVFNRDIERILHEVKQWMLLSPEA